MEDGNQPQRYALFAGFASLIFPYFDLKTVIKCSLVCKEWYTASNSDSIWRSFACAQLTTTEIDLIPEMSNWKARYQQLYYAPKQIQYTIRDLNNERKFKRILYNSKSTCGDIIDAFPMEVRGSIWTWNSGKRLKVLEASKLIREVPGLIFGGEIWRLLTDTNIAIGADGIRRESVTKYIPNTHFPPYYDYSPMQWSPNPDISVSLEQGLDLPYSEYYLELNENGKRPVHGESYYDDTEGKVKFSLKKPLIKQDYEVQLKHKSSILHSWKFKI